MPHRHRPRGYEAFDIWLKTQEDAKDAEDTKAWSGPQLRYIRDFKDYASINKVEFTDGFGNPTTRFRDRKSGRFVKGY